jgi:hypothetical protein
MHPNKHIYAKMAFNLVERMSAEEDRGQIGQQQEDDMELHQLGRL